MKEKPHTTQGSSSSRKSHRLQARPSPRLDTILESADKDASSEVVERADPRSGDDVSGNNGSHHMSEVENNRASPVHSTGPLSTKRFVTIEKTNVQPVVVSPQAPDDGIVTEALPSSEADDLHVCRAVEKAITPEQETTQEVDVEQVLASPAEPEVIVPLESKFTAFLQEAKRSQPSVTIPRIQENGPGEEDDPDQTLIGSQDDIEIMDGLPLAPPYKPGFTELHDASDAYDIRMSDHSGGSSDTDVQMPDQHEDERSEKSHESIDEDPIYKAYLEDLEWEKALEPRPRDYRQAFMRLNNVSTMHL